MDQQTGVAKWGKYAFAMACAALPWADLMPVATYLLIALAAIMLISSKFRITGLKVLLGPMTILFFLFYSLQIVAWIAAPGNEGTSFSLEQKASLALMPVLLTAYQRQYRDGWTIGIKGFIAGVISACAYSLAYAVVGYQQTEDGSVFFYHQYSSAIGANAIYMSLYALTAMSMLVYYRGVGKIDMSMKRTCAIVLFLLCNIVLLSSRLHIALSGVVLFLLLSSAIKKRVVKYAVSCLLLTSIFAFTVFDNPVSQRYQQLDVHSYKHVISNTDFTNYNFNGLDLRLLLWRMGGEVLQESHNWLLGEGGRAYHQTLNSKMMSYHLFAGNPATKDTGYLNYNMHNQYMENIIQFGIAGIAVLLGIIATAVYTAIRTNNKLLLLLTGIFSIAFLTESILETQAGILLFTIFIYGEWKRSKYEKYTPAI